MLKKKKEKKPLDKNKLLTKLALYTTIVLTVVVSFFMIKNQLNDMENDFQESVKVLNKLNDSFEISEIVLNGFSNDDFESLKLKCSEEQSDWDLFLNGGVNTTKYNELNDVGDSLLLTDRECGVLLNAILNITGNPNNVNFYELTITKTENSSRVTIRSVYSFSIKKVLSIDDEINDALKELNINLPESVYAISESVVDMLTNKIITSNITFNKLSLSDSKIVSDLLDAGREDPNESITLFSTRLLFAMNEELNNKTNTFTNFYNGGISYKIKSK